MAVRTGDWAAASEIQEFKGDEDARTYELIRCLSTSRISLLELDSYYEMYYDDKVRTRRVVSEQEATELMQLIGEKWRNFGDWV